MQGWDLGTQTRDRPRSPFFDPPPDAESFSLACVTSAPKVSVGVRSRHVCTRLLPLSAALVFHAAINFAVVRAGACERKTMTM